MELKDILAIAGKGGLFQFVSQSRNGIIVESLIDKKRTHASASTKINALKDIAIFTENEEVPLADVLKKIQEKENGEKSIDHKSDNEMLKKYMEEILPDYDKEKVYVSDIKKIINWYNILQENKLLDILNEPEEKEEDVEKTEEKVEKKAEEPAKAEKKDTTQSTVKKETPKKTTKKPAAKKATS